MLVDYDNGVRHKEQAPSIYKLKGKVTPTRHKIPL